MPASISPRRTFWARRPGRNRLDLAATIVAQHARNGGTPGHLAAQVLETAAGLAFAIVDQLDRVLAAHRSGCDVRRVLADGLVDEIRAVIDAPDRPPESHRSHRPGPNLEIAVGVGLLGGKR